MRKYQLMILKKDKKGKFCNYNGALWDFPSNLNFPKQVTLRKEIRFWYLGHTLS